MRKYAILAVAVTAEAVGTAAWWRRHRRVGSGFVNRVVDPWLVRNRVVDRSRREIALIEHIGRRTGTVRMTPVHAVPTGDGFRIIVPLGADSHWARNALRPGRAALRSALSSMSWTNRSWCRRAWSSASRLPSVG